MTYTGFSNRFSDGFSRVLDAHHDAGRVHGFQLQAKVARLHSPGGNPFDLRVRSMNSGMEVSTGVARPAADEDGELLTRVLRGDEGAMAVLFDRYSKIVYSVSLRVLRDTASAEDVMQEIFMQIWRNPNSFVSTKGSLGGWLAVVARNRSIDTLRRKRPSEQVEEMNLASSYNLADEAERSILMERARAAVKLLPTEQRKTLEMAFFDGLTHTEIAEMTGDPLGTVKTRIRSALLSLRKAFKA
jgi:RNA polymerase sigma-70 factor (ECF subfamily)